MALPTGPDPSDLIDLATVKGFMRTRAPDNDGLTQLVITGISQQILRYLGRPSFDLEEDTETFDGDGTSRLYLPRSPVTDVASVSVVAAEGSAGASTPATPIPKIVVPGRTGFTWKNQNLYLVGYSFPRGRQNVQVKYTAGFAAVPADVGLQTLKLVALRLHERDRLGLVSEGAAGVQTTYLQADLPEDVKLALKQWKRVTPRR